jgi:hypothetical protein
VPDAIRRVALCGLGIIILFRKADTSSFTAPARAWELESGAAARLFHVQDGKRS